MFLNRLSAALMVLSLTFGACSSRTIPTPTGVRTEPTQSGITQESPPTAAALTAMLSQAASPVPRLDATLGPSDTPASQRAATPIRTPSPTLVPETPTLTPDRTETAIAEAVMATSRPKTLIYDSPDGQWRVEVTIYECVAVSGPYEYSFEQLTLVRLSEGSETLVATELIFCGGLGAAGFEGLYWSPNSRYFYYTTSRVGVPDGGCGFFEPLIYRLEAANGRVDNIGGGPRSPNGTKIATWQEQDLVIWDIGAGEVARLPALAMNPGVPIAWSPDSQSLVFLQSTSDCYPYPPGKSSVFRVELAALRPALLIESEAPIFGRVLWDAPESLLLFDENGKEWCYSFLTGELQPVPWSSCHSFPFSRDAILPICGRASVGKGATAYDAIRA